MRENSWSWTRIVKLIQPYLALTSWLTLFSLLIYLISIVFECEFRRLNTTLIGVDSSSVQSADLWICDRLDEISKQFLMCFHYFCGWNLRVICRLLKLMIIFENVAKLRSETCELALLLNSSSCCFQSCSVLIQLIDMLLVLILNSKISVLIVETKCIYLIHSIGPFISTQI